MILDFADPATPDRFAADVVIAGSGPAAISLAKSLAAAGRRVLMLEAGNIHFEEESQALYKGRNLGWDYPIQWSRLRQFGGTTGHWAGQCGWMRPSDLAGGPGRPAWPIPYSELARHYQEAAAFLDVARMPSAPALAAFRPGLPGRQLLNHVWQLPATSPVRLGEREEPILRRHRTIHLLVHAAVTGVTDVSGDGTVGGFRFRTLAGRTGEARGRILVLACGGIENARLLRVMQYAGLPLAAGSAEHIGLYLQEHLSATFGLLSASGDGEKLTEVAMELVPGVGGTLLPAISMPPEVQARSGAGGCYFRFMPRGHKDSFVPGRTLRPPLTRHRIPYYLRQFDEISFEKMARRFPHFLSYNQLKPAVGLFVEMEQLPDSRNRVRLGRERDAIGLPVVEVDMQARDSEIVTAKAAIEHLGRAAISNGLGRVGMMDWVADALQYPQLWGWSWHHNGTTRMAHRAVDGVVDPDHLVFGTRNLHMAGASVFPTSGFANPTLTIVAMSLRLAEILKARL